jgi:hypothetical protein
VTLATGWPNGSASQGAFTWTVTGRATTRARFRVTHTAGTSTGTTVVNTALADPRVTVTELKTLLIGRTYALKFTHNLGKGQPVRIELQRGGEWQTLFASVDTTAATASSHSWMVAGPATTTARLRVTWLSGSATDESNAAFVIK